MSMWPVDDMSAGSGSMLFPISGAFNGDEYRPEERGKRLFLVGGPWGPLYPLGLSPLDYEDEEDPNP